MKTGTLALAACAAAVCAGQVKIDSAAFGQIEARAIGPAVMSGRITSIAGNPRNPMVLYVGSAGGGLWKTTNGGTTFRPVFDRYDQSIGAVALDPSNPETVWVGTGEPWVRNSVSVGSGIYRSADGGDNWQFVGLPESERIARIIVNPKDSKSVYACVLGKLWSDSAERGLYRTTDGGKTWTKALYVNERTGCADIDIDPQETQVVYAAMWEFRRKPWTFKSGGPGSGLHRSSDGGKTWEKVTAGMPEGELGRIAIAVSPARPSTVYALAEAKKTALLRSDDTGKTWASVNTSGTIGERPFYFSLLVADPKDYKRLYKPGLLLYASEDGGKSFSTLGASTFSIPYHPDTHALWIDPNQTSTLYVGTDGGVYKSLDTGATWQQLRNLPVSQFYHATFDMERPFNVYGGLQDNGSWAGPSEAAGGVRNRDWRNVGFGDGFYVFPHPADGNVVYSQYQGGKFLRFHKATGEIKSIAPHAKPGEPKLRFNWNAAAALSKSNPDWLYVGAQSVFRSKDRGESWERISPDLTTNDPEKQKQAESGGLTIDNSAAENHTTIYAIAESPLDAKVIWAVTDDGNVQVTRDAGKSWKNVAGNLPGAPKFALLSSVEASRHAAAAAYVTVDAHMFGDMRPYVYRTRDYGATWEALAAEPMKGYAHVVREDVVKPDLLFVGTELGLWVTIDGGKQWAQFTGNLPNVAVRDIAIHPRDHAAVVATHGRGIYLIDDLTALRQLTQEVLESKFRVLESAPAPVRTAVPPQSYGGGDEFVGLNPQEAAHVVYWLKERHMIGDFKIEVLGPSGEVITSLSPGTRRGVNRVAWPMRLRPPRVPRSGTLLGGLLTGPAAPEGTYTARLTKDGEMLTAQLRLVADPRSPHTEIDRKLQQKTVNALYQMVERLAYISAAATELRDQARERAGQAPDAVKKDLEGFASALEELSKTLAAQREGGITGEEKLREMAGTLYGEVLRFGGRPTQSQIDRAAALEKEVANALASFDAISGARLEDMNGKLKTAGLVPLRKLTREEFDKRSR
jgi:photosystem II stability/assembly factor-like uncharacterized protein